MRKSDIRLLTMVSGVFIALIIVFSQFFQFQTHRSSKKQIKTEQEDSKQTDSGGGNEYYFSQPSASTPSASPVALNHESFYLLEVLTETDGEEDTRPKISFYSGELFETLFRVIISPNAP